MNCSKHICAPRKFLIKHQGLSQPPSLPPKPTRVIFFTFISFPSKTVIDHREIVSIAQFTGRFGKVREAGCRKTRSEVITCSQT